MWLTDSEVLELNCIRFCDKGSALKIFLFFGHVKFMFLEGFFFILFFEVSQFSNVENFVSVLIVFDKAFFVILVH